MILFYLPLIVLGVGLAMYLFLSNPKGERVGEIMFFCGLLALLLKGLG